MRGKARKSSPTWRERQRALPPPRSPRSQRGVGRGGGQGRRERCATFQEGLPARASWAQPHFTPMTHETVSFPPILQIRKLRLREVERGHLERKRVNPEFRRGLGSFQNPSLNSHSSRGGGFHYPHCADEGNTAKRGQAAPPRSHSSCGAKEPPLSANTRSRDQSLPFPVQKSPWGQGWEGNRCRPVISALPATSNNLGSRGPGLSVLGGGDGGEKPGQEPLSSHSHTEGGHQSGRPGRQPGQDGPVSCSSGPHGTDQKPLRRVRTAGGRRGEGRR